MPADQKRAREHMGSVLSGRSAEQAATRLAPSAEELPPAVPAMGKSTPAAIAARWATVGGRGKGALGDDSAAASAEHFAANIEGYIGTVRIPVGLAGPVRVNGLSAKGDYYIPLATTEAALVSSYSRGMRVISESGGCAALVLNEGVTRAPAFVFSTLAEVGRFSAWVLGKEAELRAAAASTTRYGSLSQVRLAVEGNRVHLLLDFTTADASGQNMVTIASHAVCEWIVRESPVVPRAWYVEANMSGDKKASTLTFQSVRGRKVCAEVVVPAKIIRRRLHATPRQMAEYWAVSALGAAMSGSIGVHGHVANGLAALYLACGQDAACIAESSVGITRMECTDAGDLYAAVTLPSVMVGTVGGGTSIPTARACLEILGLAGEGNARALAEVAAAVSLAGELSIVGALCTGQFAGAHERLARQRGSVSGKGAAGNVDRAVDGAEGSDEGSGA